MHAYETDIVAWANEQARLLRARRFEELDIEHIAEEIEDVGKSEQREWANRMAPFVGPSAQVAVSTRASRGKLAGHHPQSTARHPASARGDAESARPSPRADLVGGGLG